MISQGTQVSELREFRRTFYQHMKSRNECNSFSVDIICYKGALKEPQWRDIEPCMTVHCYCRLKLISSNPASFSTLCKIHADLSKLSRTLRPRKSSLDRSDYYTIDFEVIMLFGLTELKALVSWKYEVVLLSSLIHPVYVVQGVGRFLIDTLV
jgi:hypothetical protein